MAGPLTLNPWSEPIFPQGAGFGAGSPAEASQQPSLTDLVGRMFSAVFPQQQQQPTQPDPVKYTTASPLVNITQGDIDNAVNVGMGVGPLSIKAYHGSPHDFDKFDLSKIGTGEGAQAYGHGLYFAENEGVAKVYRDALSGKNMTLDGAKYNTNDPLHNAAAVLDKFNGDREAALKWLGGSRVMQPTYDALKSGVDLPKVSRPAHMYEVNINADPEHFLDWDKPLSQQPKAVQDLYNAKVAPGLKTREIGVNPNLGPLTDVIHPEGGSLGTFTKDQLPDVLANPAKYAPTRGENFYRELHESAIRSGKAEPAKIKEQQVTQTLNNAGIPGIKYLDQGSRGAGEGSRNYVVFNHDLIDIMKKYAMPGIIGAPIFANAASEKKQ